MRYIPQRSLLKATLFGLILLFMFYVYRPSQTQLGNAIPVQAAVPHLHSKIVLQEPENDYSIYLPAVTQPPSLELTNVWTADEYRTPRDAFLPGKVIRHYARGYVNIPDATLISLRWSVIGPCGSKILFDGTGRINQGLWTLYQTDVAPDCPGVYTYTLRMAYQEDVLQETVSYVVNHPSEVVSMNLQGFDKCNIPTVNQMQTWWNLSPYYSTNLYIGGVSRYCTNSGLDAVWVNQVSKQGWSFIPTWVGPQAPCTTYRYRFSYTPSTSYYQGIAEADAAVETARNLGFLGNSVLYYDMEMYSTTNLSCITAVNSFLAGWSERLQDHGIRSGVYGHRNNVNSWAAIEYPGTPNNVWVASWIRSYYDPYVSAYGIPGISDDLWRDQRIRQYAGDHAEYYGGIGFSVDSNIMDGEVTVLPNPELGAAALGDSEKILPLDTQAVENSPVSGKQIKDLQLINGDRGWAIVDNRILWTGDGGGEWRDITPPSAAPGSILAAEFLDERSGYSVAQNSVSGEVSVFTTTDQGEDWQVSKLKEGDLTVGPLASAVYLEFSDNLTGWVVLKLVSSANFSPGRLFHTQDGGATWEEHAVPFGAPVRFLNSKQGWVAGGPAGNQLFSTLDGGRTWQEQDIASLIPRSLEEVTLGLPEFKGENYIAIPVHYQDPGSNVIDYLETRDGGISWQFSNQAVVDGPSLRLSSLAAAASLESKLPEGVVKVEITAEGQAWAHIDSTLCSGIKTPLQKGYTPSDNSFLCEKQSSIWSTRDGGENWIDITP